LGDRGTEESLKIDEPLEISRGSFFLEEASGSATQAGCREESSKLKMNCQKILDIIYWGYQKE